MTTYNVHIYREMRLSFGGIEAGSPEEAARKARDLTTAEADSIDDCDGDTSAALVDVAGDEQHTHSRTIDFEPERSRKAGRAAALLLDLIRYGVLSLEEGDAEFGDTMYAFDDNAPDWTALVEAIGWDVALKAIEEGVGA